MLRLPDVGTIFPNNERGAIRLFWVTYWFWFFVFLPWMLVRQVGISLSHAIGAVATWNRQVELLDGTLRLVFMNSIPSFLLTTIFGERFTAIHYRDVLIDPGPPFAKRRLTRYLKGSRPEVHAIAVTHSHEEHAGNAALAARLSEAPIYATAFTLEAIGHPERISLPRRVFIGQPEPAQTLDLRTLAETLTTEQTSLQAIQSPGHCEGHASLFDPTSGILFAGDSFLHTIFTAPNKDVSGDDWIRTLREYLARDIRTMIGTHGLVHTTDDRLPRKPFVIDRTDPKELVEDKLTFMTWARDVVAEGESRKLPYSVIEACLFPWQRSWSWQTWFTDEGGRLFSGGEFSRTYFVRSLSKTPYNVPPRFLFFARLLGRSPER